MISSTRHLSLRVTKVLIVFFLITFSGCEKKQDKPDYVAKVNNSFLTREEFASLVDTVTSNQTKKNEIIKSWIQRELLYQKAEREGILKEEYNLTVTRSAKQLAGAMLVDKILKAENFNFNQQEIKAYYDENINEFRVTSETFILNIVEFIDEDKAITFRHLAIESDWRKATNQFLNDQSIVNQKSNQFLLIHEINPSALSRMVNELYPQEISIVISTKPGYYSVVQLVEKIAAGSIPALRNIAHEVEKRLIAVKRQIFIDEFIKELYSQSEIDIKN